MPGRVPTLTDLHATYSALAAQPIGTLTAEQRRSVSFYLADIGADEAPEPLVAQWVSALHRLDRFMRETRRLPRADSVRPRPRTREQHLVDWLAYQRRPQVRRALCDYQLRRLETLPGFRWAPQDDTWHATFDAHQRFWERHGHAPSRRSTDAREAALGRWVAHQRANHRSGILLPEREQLLRAASYRVL
ncbi:helicase associated domain-containing protein [Curtobacterium ammoniigenes]|uniref:helicase associated domain-containing protein n=1 Tax=Curtobacterium ammoniigenes TaxID=395387 RepID=UPI0008339B36|nr:helicase associated domain-containing protein [Curtobacterium ammoniigenes]